MLQASDGPGAEDAGRSQVRKTWTHLQNRVFGLTVPRLCGEQDILYSSLLLHLLSHFHGVSECLLCDRQDINIGGSRVTLGVQHAQFPHKDCILVGGRS